MPRSPKTPQNSPSDLLEVIEKLRKMGASNVSVTRGDTEVAASFRRKRAKERQPAIGFHVDAAPEEYDED
jgi:hypothetical protein